MPLDNPPQLLQLGDHLPDDGDAQSETVIEKFAQRVLKSVFVQLATPVFVLLQIHIRVSLVHLHAAKPHSQGGGRARRTFCHLFRSVRQYNVRLWEFCTQYITFFLLKHHLRAAWCPFLGPRCTGGCNGTWCSPAWGNIACWYCLIVIYFLSRPLDSLCGGFSFCKTNN